MVGTLNAFERPVHVLTWIQLCGSGKIQQSVHFVNVQWSSEWGLHLDQQEYSEEDI